jgi:enoyl-CoA hydratase
MRMDRYGLSTIATELDGDRILRVTLNRPERRNAIDAVMHDELRQLYGRMADDTEIEVVVITGAGKGFCAGADFKQMQDNNDAAAYDDGFSSLFVDGVAIARNILAVRRPMIAAVNGDAIGLGATIALFCDVVFMADGARIGDPHVAAGLVAGDGGAVLWPLLVGVNRAKEYLMTGDLLSAAEAERIGLVNHVVPGDELEEAAMAMARRLAKGPALAIRFNRQLVNKELEDRVGRLYDAAFAMEAITFRSADHAEAVRAFGEKRAPVFQRGLR